jgi:hypothetical protein
MTTTAFTRLVQTRLGVLPDAEPGAITLAALDRRLPPQAAPTPAVLPASQAGLMVSPERRLAILIITSARRFCGLREVKPNASWDNPDTPGLDTALVAELRAGMRQSPWEDGWAYCAAFAEFIIATALAKYGATPAQIAKWRGTMSPHCMTAARAFRELALLSPVPVPGALWLARHGTTDNGHAGLVELPHTETMDTIEANTSSGQSGSQRDGDWITTRLRPISGPGDLRTQGFVHPASILRLIGASV